MTDTISVWNSGSSETIFNVGNLRMRLEGTPGDDRHVFNVGGSSTGRNLQATDQGVSQTDISSVGTP